MAISCVPDSLAESAKCFMGYGPLILKAIRIRLACAFLNSETMDCSVESLLAEANCILSGMSSDQMDAVETQLFCQLVNAGGGGGSGCVTCTATVPVDPPDVGECECSVKFGIGPQAYNVWVWDNGYTDTWIAVIGGP